MIGMRHEEYSSIPHGLPFVLHTALERTPYSRSAEQNWHKELEIQLCIAGEGTVLLNGKSYPFRPDDIAVVNSDVIHHTDTETKLCYTCLIVKTDFCNQMGLDCGGISFEPQIQNPRLAGMIKELSAVYQDNDLPHRTLRLHKILISVLSELLAYQKETALPPTVAKHGFDNVKAAIGYIRQSYDRKISLDELAKITYSDKYALCRNFKRLTGQTVVQYINLYRCQKAAEMITNGQTVAEAAHLCGFDNLSFFTKTFKHYMGALPSFYKT